MSPEQTIDEITIQNHVEAAAEQIGRVWPLYNDVAANPLRGYEQQDFWEAVHDANQLLGGDGYPSVDQFRQALENDNIDRQILSGILNDHGINHSPQELLQQMRSESDSNPNAGKNTKLDRLMSKWLAAFLDQGQATWSMPNRSNGFYQSWCEMAVHDSRIPGHKRLNDLPKNATEALAIILSNHPEEDWSDILRHHLSELPGWAGYIKQQMEKERGWQTVAPITLTQYLAVRLLLSRHLQQVKLSTAEHTHIPEEAATRSSLSDSSPPIKELWLSAWEKTYRSELLSDVSAAAQDTEEGTEQPDAQLVFCIDTRSEIIRRKIEQTGKYHTHGYAGFFGIPMRHESSDSKCQHNACPAIIDPNYLIKEQHNNSEQGDKYDQLKSTAESMKGMMKSLKSDVIGAFGFVEVAGGGYAPLLSTRTLAPSLVNNVYNRVSQRFGNPNKFSNVKIDKNVYKSNAETLTNQPDKADPTNRADAIKTGMSLDDKVTCAKAAFNLMGWDSFAPIVAFVGHTSQTDNNPYKSSIDCGACSGNSGLPNARVLSKICNESSVRGELENEGISIPEETVFIAGEHNTTTDNIDLLVPEGISEMHQAEIEQLQSDLETAQRQATIDRMETIGVDTDTPVSETERRSADWAEPRPEIGLSGNASFVIAPREITSEVDFRGRAFLHSYDYANDETGDALENIFAGPLVVTKMINMQYYFSTVDLSTFGSGSKVTHNPVGHLGVLQGNGGDLMIGLPKQSLIADDGELYHKPLRQSVVVHAPVERVTRIIDHNPQISQLLDNGWMHLSVVDPEQQNRVFQYEGMLNWSRLEDDISPAQSDISYEASSIQESEVSTDGGGASS